MTKSVYLVVEPITIIALDLALCVQDYDPSAKIIVAHTSAEAVAAVVAQSAVCIAFVHADPDGFDASDLGKAVTKRGAACVFMGDRAERTTTGAIHVLQRPFSSETLATLLDGLCDRCVAA